MAGPNSAPNGDTTIVRGHVNEEFIRVKRWDAELELEWFEEVPKRTYLAQRNRLRTGKTA